MNCCWIKSIYISLRIKQTTCSIPLHSYNIPTSINIHEKLTFVFWLTKLVCGPEICFRLISMPKIHLTKLQGYLFHGRTWNLIVNYLWNTHRSLFIVLRTNYIGYLITNMIYHTLGLFLWLYSMQLKVVMSFTSSLQQYSDLIYVGVLLFVTTKAKKTY